MKNDKNEDEEDILRATPNFSSDNIYFSINEAFDNEHKIVSFSLMPSGNIYCMESCDEYFRGELSPDDARKIGEKLIEWSRIGVKPSASSLPL